jgi:two-component system OmpR family response regulator
VAVLFLTGCASEADQVRGLELGADQYVVKPFSHLELLARIRSMIRRARATPRSARCPISRRVRSPSISSCARSGWPVVWSS